MGLIGIAIDGAQVYDQVDSRGRKVVGPKLLDDGTEYVSFGVFVSISDLLVGTEGFGIAALIAIQDAAAGAESLSCAAAIAVLETVAAAEGLTIAVQLTIGETSVGADSASVNMDGNANINIGDLAVGVDLSQISAAIAIIEEAAGEDNPIAEDLRSLQESMTGSDTIAISVVLAVIEQATGSDVTFIAGNNPVINITFDYGLFSATASEAFV